ncbi:recombinase family protein [Peloplasma aerotolerans]|uniref:Recombinase family protein n=1 Tax=Peloplasma aerotolerans TaxID=3044389 RepID=A0AAW6U3C1_9MOLU|nr:recombinase family protein [Mariniplasma sp. M4Ah]MDI6452362.1 recombinase family protein [Mariniplasma sp. M4Ah]
MKEIKVIEKNSVKYAQTRLKRVAAYARVSTKLEMQQSSIDLQIKHYAKEIIFNPNYIFAGIYADHGKSGRSMDKRDGLQKLLKKIRAGHIDLVLVKSLSRFARNTVDSLKIIQETRRLGVEFYFEKEGIYSSDTTVDMILSMMSGMAEQESQSMGQNISWGFQKRAQKGQVVLHKLLGYAITEDKQYKPMPKITHIIQTLFKMKLNGSEMSELIAYAKSQDLKSTKGYPITTYQQINSILKDIRYTGTIEYGKTYMKHDGHGKRTIINDGDKPKYVIRNHHEAMIDHDTFQNVQSLMIKEKRTYDKNTSIPNVLSDFVFDLDSYKTYYRPLDKGIEMIDNMLDPKYLNNPHFPKSMSKTVIHILKRSLNALGRKFSDLEPKFDKRVQQLLSIDKIDEQLNNIGYIIKTYKDKYYTLKRKDHRDAAELAMLKDLEDEIIKFSIDYINIEDEKIKHDHTLRHAKNLKQRIQSFEYPLDSLTPEMLLSYVKQLVRVDEQNYVLVINATGDMVSPYKIKKAMTEKPLLEGDCKMHQSRQFDWKIVIL